MARENRGTFDSRYLYHLCLLLCGCMTLMGSVVQSLDQASVILWV